MELENLIAGDDPLASDETGERLTHLVRYIQQQDQMIHAKDTALAERAKDMRNALLGPAAYRPMAA